MNTIIDNEKIKNYYSDCVSLGMQWGEIINDQVTNRKGRSLIFQIVFGHQTKEIGKFGSVIFGTNFTELRLTLENGNMPLSTRAFCQTFPDSIQKTIKRGKTGQSTRNIETGLESTFGSKDGIIEGSITPSIKNTRSQQQEAKISEEYDYPTFQALTKGNDDCPAWEFCAKSGEIVLLGSILPRSLGHIFPKNSSNFRGVYITLKTNPENIVLTNTSNLAFPISVTPNKSAIAKILLTKRIREEFHNNLCEGYLPYEHQPK